MTKVRMLMISSWDFFCDICVDPGVIRGPSRHEQRCLIIQQTSLISYPKTSFWEEGVHGWSHASSDRLWRNNGCPWFVHEKHNSLYLFWSRDHLATIKAWTNDVLASQQQFFINNPNTFFARKWTHGLLHASSDLLWRNNWMFMICPWEI